MLFISLLFFVNLIQGGESSGCCFPTKYQSNISVWTNSLRHPYHTDLLFTTDSSVPITRIDYYGNYTGNGTEHLALWDIYQTGIMYLYSFRTGICRSFQAPDFEPICVNADYDWSYAGNSVVLTQECESWTTDSISNGSNTFVILNEPTSDLCIPVFFRYVATECFLLQEWSDFSTNIPSDQDFWTPPDVCLDKENYSPYPMEYYGDGYPLWRPHPHRFGNPSC